MNNTNRVKVGMVVDEETGVILTDIYEGDKIIRKSQSDYNNKYVTNFNKKELFVKVNINPLKEMWKELSMREFAVATALIPYISYKDGILRNNGISINLKEISLLLEIDYEAIRKIIPILEKKMIIQKTEIQSERYANKMKKCYVVNPYLFLRGTDIEYKILELFHNSKWSNISENKKEI